VDVLIVDDNELNVRALQRVLGRLHAVRIATCARAALEAVRQRRPDVILCDFELGDHTCTELLRIVTREWPGVRRVLYSASQPEQWTELVSDHLIDAALAKPVSTQTLLAALDGISPPG
jgi:CheY-like chemotaxis protein